MQIAVLRSKRVGLALLVEGHHHHGGAVAARDPRLVNELLLAFLQRDRVDDRLALHAFQAGLDHLELRGIDHHRHAGDVRLRGDQVEELNHRLLRIEQALVHVDVDHLRAVLDLVARHRQRGGVVAGGDQLAEACRAGDVGALADIDEGNVGGELERRQPRELQPRFDRRHRARLVRRHRGGDGGDVVRRGAAAAADHVDQAGLRELADQPRHVVGGLVVLAELVGQAGVRIGADQRVGDAADVGDMGAQVFGAERAIEADGERACVLHRVPNASGSCRDSRRPTGR